MLKMKNYARKMQNFKQNLRNFGDFMVTDSHHRHHNSHLCRSHEQQPRLSQPRPPTDAETVQMLELLQEKEREQLQQLDDEYAPQTGLTAAAPSVEP